MLSSILKCCLYWFDKSFATFFTHRALIKPGNLNSVNKIFYAIFSHKSDSELAAQIKKQRNQIHERNKKKEARNQIYTACAMDSHRNYKCDEILNCLKLWREQILASKRKDLTTGDLTSMFQQKVKQRQLGSSLFPHPKLIFL